MLPPDGNDEMGRDNRPISSYRRRQPAEASLAQGLSAACAILSRGSEQPLLAHTTTYLPYMEMSLLLLAGVPLVGGLLLRADLPYLVALACCLRLTPPPPARRRCRGGRPTGRGPAAGWRWPSVRGRGRACRQTTGRPGWPASRRCGGRSRARRRR